MRHTRELQPEGPACERVATNLVAMRRDGRAAGEAFYAMGKTKRGAKRYVHGANTCTPSASKTSIIALAVLPFDTAKPLSIPRTVSI